jgi:hypothetical protein
MPGAMNQTDDASIYLEAKDDSQALLNRLAIDHCFDFALK